MLEQAVAVRVPERVVDRLEVVEVDDHEHGRHAVAAQLSLEPLGQQDTIRQPGERVVHRAVGVAGGLAGTEVDGEHRQQAQRHQRDRDLSAGGDHRGEPEDEPRREQLERHVGDQVPRRRLTHEQRRSDAGEHMVDREERHRTCRHGG